MAAIDYKEWPFSWETYDRSPYLSEVEQTTLTAWATKDFSPLGKPLIKILQRLIRPIEDVLRHTGYGQRRTTTLYTCQLLFTDMHRRQNSLWAWTTQDWVETIGLTPEAYRIKWPQDKRIVRHCLLVCAYLLTDGSAFRYIGGYRQELLAKRIFGTTAVQVVVDALMVEMVRLGIRTHPQPKALSWADLNTLVSEILLINHSPDISILSPDTINYLHTKYLNNNQLRRECIMISRALHGLGVISKPLQGVKRCKKFNIGLEDTIPLEWLTWMERWYAASTAALSTRKANRSVLGRIGRWMAITYPTITKPADWTRDIAIAFVAAVDRSTLNQWVHPKYPIVKSNLGKPHTPNAKSSMLAVLRTFFLDCQDWEWCRFTFDPRRSLSTPRSISTLRGPNPRVIAEDTWAKLLSAGLSLTETDFLPYTGLGKAKGGTRAEWYPIDMVRAIVLVWLFAGLRANELRRLRVGCIQWRMPDETSSLTEPELKSVCLLQVPINKTSKEFVKPVDSVVGEAIRAWERVRPASPAQHDIKTGEQVHFLFTWRAKTFGKSYLNLSIIPMLCRKAGIPEHDARGNITSHRARSTIATQLYNARQPMTLFQLQEWLGHMSISSTQHYAKITPTKLAQAYADADYFSRNIRVMEVLIDQQAIQSGAAAAGEPWKYYDLGHGYCTYDFFDQCAHRMACAKCSFYRPKSSSTDQLIEGKNNLQRMLQQIPLLEDERAAVEDGVEALNKLLQRLTSLPTPDGRSVSNTDLSKY